MTKKWVYREGLGVIPAETAPLRKSRAPAVVADGIDPLRSMVTGKVHESKSSLRAEYKAHGVREVGNDCLDRKEWGTTGEPQKELERRGQWVDFDG